MQQFRNLDVWQSAMTLTYATYRSLASLPSTERFELSAQIRRSAISIPSNIAEGCGRNSQRELAFFVGVAMGSLYELETQLELADGIYGLGDDAELRTALEATRAKLLRFREVVRQRLDDSDYRLH